MNSSTGKVIAIVIVIAVLVLGYRVVTMPDQRTPAQKLGDAVHELPQGVDKASQELKDDRTPGQKLGDAVRNTGDKIKENSDPQ